MRKTTWRSGRALGAVLALGALVVASAPADAAAQERTRTERRECRCVDPDGNPIEDCWCFTVPDVGGIVAQALPGGRPRLGITLGGSDPRGAPVESVLEDGPADEAGIREGDIITKLDGESLLEPLGPDLERTFDEDESLPVQRLMAIVRRIEPGQEVEVEYLRDGTRATTTIEARDLDTWAVTIRSPGWDEDAFHRRMENLGSRLRDLRIVVPRNRTEVKIPADSIRAPRVIVPKTPDVIVAPRWREQGFEFVTPGSGYLQECPGEDTAGGFTMVFSDRCIGGLALVELTPGLAEYFGTERGVLVSDVHEDSKLGLRPGDVILSVGDREVADPDRVRRILRTYEPDETVTLRIMRQKLETSVTGTLAR